jgi:anti-sigma regulatory factor (Ser/Thr protein kinase)
MAVNHQTRPDTREVDEEPFLLDSRRLPPSAGVIPQVDWRISVPGVSAMVSTARRLVHAALTNSPRAGDVELIISELVTNAIRHTPCGQAGGTVTLRVLATAGWVRVEVRDLGTPTLGEPARSSQEDECGRGLIIVEALADRAGREPAPGGQIAWAELTWS